VTDPEQLSNVDPADLEVEPGDDFDPDLPVEADEADAFDQKRDVPDAGEDDYPA
jgi:hypothetical protein